MELLEIPTFSGTLDATVDIPGSKSITNRALLVAALANSESTISGALFSEDTHWFSKCLGDLGIPITGDADQATFTIIGKGGAIPQPQADLFVGNAGTAARFITAMLALGHGTYRVDGIARMRERPMGELLTVLEQMGPQMSFENQPGCMPYVLHSNGLNGGTIRMRAHQTSQQLSALLMVAPYAQHNTIINIDGELVSRSYIEITRRVMADFGVTFEQQGDQRFLIHAGQQYQPRTYHVEPDASNASYFFAAAAITRGRIRVKHLSGNSCQGDFGFVEVLAKMGCQIHTTEDYTEVVGPETLRGIEVDMNDISDTVQTLAAIAPFADAPVTIRNVAHIRVKETDRIHAVVTELQRLGVQVDEFQDGLRIYPSQPHPTSIQTYNDHRMAMAFAVLGLRVPGVVINDSDCTHKTFPTFFDTFLGLWE
ncbi:MAG: 3-phosphoshikimate 1-carboxyvinyltransferase [Chloroflexi bacterium AL-W]|nr:3-phosphoshikimate 1-carboxyvinyltransferase [Chloroflexi bacterium AL-N1]NOK70599.1 3-phosphoshikimate 1-carboxyvinyltransferase [Chloroflexi bacterium AL-N10]NOK77591.1 3-phosphoshikimate 1-carboxyvinyltransferase [Chloroflexi bacterium AL-N5]NOK84442.1 3-phosphoshikimate 1-carboxyvinyltransferase [Chloroflexi bacterium AL-W]NOK92331.1 3-phosphoshikimate 1-carboxyvinyltransferase [Chloroflexi bacterium AL-N15]